MSPQTRYSSRRKSKGKEPSTSTAVDAEREGSEAASSVTENPGELGPSKVELPDGSSGLNQLGASYSFFVEGEDSWEMDELGAPAMSKTKEVKFTGRNEAMRVSELKIKVQNKISLLAARRSATAPSLSAMDTFAVLLESCDGDAWHALHDHFRARLDQNLQERARVDARNKEMEQKLVEDWFTKKEKGEDPGPFHPGPKLQPKEDSSLMDDAWTFLQQTYPERTAAALRDYLLFSFDKARTTQGMFHQLRELCRLNGKPDTGREVIEKAVFALRPDLRRTVEQQTLTWTEAQLTLANLETVCRQVEEALHTRELGRAPVKMVRGDLSAKVGGLSLRDASTGRRAKLQRRGIA